MLESRTAWEAGREAFSAFIWYMRNLGPSLRAGDLACEATKELRGYPDCAASNVTRASIVARYTWYNAQHEQGDTAQAASHLSIRPRMGMVALHCRKSVDHDQLLGSCLAELKDQAMSGKIVAEDVPSILVRVAAGERKKLIANEYGVMEGLILKVVRGWVPRTRADIADLRRPHHFGRTCPNDDRRSPHRMA